MAALVWDNIGERVFQAGVDRGVLYLPDDSGVVWNGLISVNEIFNREVKVFHLDGIKYLEYHSLGDYAAELKAFTYPDEFDQINGIAFDNTLGLSIHDQKPSSFGLSYRTLIGDDSSGVDRGYKIHILYNLLANPSSIPYDALSDKINPIQFTWTLSGTPVIIPGYRPTSHISLDSTKIHPDVLILVENILYGSEDSESTLPPIEYLIGILAEPDFITIIDNGDGTWTAIGPSGLITMLNSTTFEIMEANATYLDSETYTISTTGE